MTGICRRAFSPPDGRVAVPHRLLRILPIVAGLLVVANFALPARAQLLTLRIDDISGDGFSAQAIEAQYSGNAVALRIGTLKLAGQSWQGVRLDCAALKLERTRIACDDGVLQLAEKIPLAFSYDSAMRVLDVALKPAKDEAWQLNLQPATQARRGSDLTLRIEGGRAQRVALWLQNLPKDTPKVTGGVLNGVVRYGADGRIGANLALVGASFSDAKGLHAGEKLGMTLAFNATPAADHLRWDAVWGWQGGEAFWQPLYVKAANQQLSAAGRLDAKLLRVERGALRYPGVGELAFTGAYDFNAGKLTEARASAQAIAVPALYDAILKPLLAGGAFDDLRSDGRVSGEIALNGQGVQSVDLRLEHVAFEDKAQRRFALFDINGTVPWRAAAPTQAAVTVKGGEVLKMPVGGFALPLNMNGMRFDLKQLRVPLLDGAIDIRDFVVRAGESGWYWQFGGEVSGISMDKFTAALGVPVMHGTLAASLPMVRHVKSSLRVDGALNLNVFDGSIQAKNLVLLDLFGKAPRVQGDVLMKNLDLELVTRTYSFGNITGRIDARVAGLELVNWQPVKFEAELASSAGEYPRKISQTAVNNITALGGGGATAAVQRSVLRFFEQFGYEKLGWRCKLANGICEMSGVEDAPQGYVLVKGGGIPAITVMGYNRQVNWKELLERIQRVTQGNTKPIVK